MDNSQSANSPTLFDTTIPLGDHISIDPAEYPSLPIPNHRKAQDSATELIHYIAKTFKIHTRDATLFVSGIVSALEGIPCPIQENSSVAPARIMRDFLRAKYPDRYPHPPSTSPKGLF